MLNRRTNFEMAGATRAATGGVLGNGWRRTSSVLAIHQLPAERALTGAVGLRTERAFTADEWGGGIRRRCFCCQCGYPHILTALQFLYSRTHQELRRWVPDLVQMIRRLPPFVTGVRGTHSRRKGDVWVSAWKIIIATLGAAAHCGENALHRILAREKRSH